MDLITSKDGLGGFIQGACSPGMNSSNLKRITWNVLFSLPWLYGGGGGFSQLLKHTVFLGFVENCLTNMLHSLQIFNIMFSSILKEQCTVQLLLTLNNTFFSNFIFYLGQVVMDWDIGLKKRMFSETCYIFLKLGMLDKEYNFILVQFKWLMVNIPLRGHI